jgi:hypothetical protein
MRLHVNIDAPQLRLGRRDESVPFVASTFEFRRVFSQLELSVISDFPSEMLLIHSLFLNRFQNEILHRLIYTMSATQTSSKTEQTKRAEGRIQSSAEMTLDSSEWKASESFS